MNDRPDTDIEAMQRAYLLKHQGICSGQVIRPRSETMNKRVVQLLHRVSRQFGFPIY